MLTNWSLVLQELTDFLFNTVVGKFPVFSATTIFNVLAVVFRNSKLNILRAIGLIHTKLIFYKHVWCLKYMGLLAKLP